MLYFFNKKRITLILIPVFAIVVLAVIVISYEKIQQTKMARGYILELQHIDSLDGEKRTTYIENIFNKSENSLYKVYFGTRLINDIHKKNPDKAISIARQILSIRNLPDYISDAIATKLSYIYLDQLSDMKNRKEKSKEIEEYLLLNKATQTVFYPLRQEAYLEILLLNGDINGYYDGIVKLQKNSTHLPSYMAIRLGEMQHNMDFLVNNNR